MPTNTRSDEIVDVSFTPAVAGDCISDKWMRELERRMTLKVQATSNPGDAIISRTPPEDTTRVWYPADINGYPIGVAYVYDPLQGQWVPTVDGADQLCVSTDNDNIISRDNNDCIKVSQQAVIDIAQQIGLFVSGDNGNAIQFGSDGGLFVDVATQTNVGQIALFNTPETVDESLVAVSPTTYTPSGPPVWATHAIVAAQVNLITDDFPSASTGKTVAYINAGGNRIMDVGYASGPNTVHDFNTSNTSIGYATLVNGEFDYEFALTEAANWNASDQIRFKLSIIGYVRASSL